RPTTRSSQTAAPTRVTSTFTYTWCRGNHSTRRPRRVSSRSDPLDPANVPRGFVRPDPGELRVPQQAISGPFGEGDFHDHPRINPPELFHILGCQPLAPSTALCDRQIAERTMIDLKRREQLNQNTFYRGSESGANL